MKADIINVIDLEATCWNDTPVPKGQSQEIIEIGISEVCISDRTIFRSEGILIKPTRSIVSDFCEELTSLSQSLLEDRGITFNEALDYLRDEYRSKNRIWASWGNWDRHMMKNQCKAFGLSYPFSQSHLNIKELFSMKKGFKNLKGLGRALKIEDVEFEGTPHRGVDDTVNMSRILLRILGDTHDS